MGTCVPVLDLQSNWIFKQELFCAHILFVCCMRPHSTGQVPEKATCACFGPTQGASAQVVSRKQRRAEEPSLAPRSWGLQNTSERGSIFS